jgi:hypothetical protein
LRRRATPVGCHVPPRGALMPWRFSSSAIIRLPETLTKVAYKISACGVTDRIVPPEKVASDAVGITQVEVYEFPIPVAR